VRRLLAWLAPDRWLPEFIICTVAGGALAGAVIYRLP
jgi:hypothetical protein